MDNAVPPGRMWRVRRHSAGFPPQARICGDGDLVTLAHPTFEPGQVVTYRRQQVTVLRDDGDTTVRLICQVLRPRNLDRHDGFGRIATVQVIEVEVNRGELCSENL